jgi:hypothetical protein
MITGLRGIALLAVALRPASVSQQGPGIDRFGNRYLIF